MSLFRSIEAAPVMLQSSSTYSAAAREGGSVRFYPVGAAALLVELDDLAAVLALHAEIGRRRAGGWAPSLVDVIPAARTILLDGVTDRAATERQIRGWDVRPAAAPDGPVVEIPCRYDGEDLAAVASLWEVTEREAARIHAGTEYRVAFCGFAPGFAYLTGLSEELAVPRRPTPRAAVPAGSVALAGPYTGVYPRSSPGGWQLIGSTDAVIWDASRDPPALLAPGTRVRFTGAGS
jgi:KipI family sensor histidine kinase inhibitor